MIVTLTPNPSLDRTGELPALVPGEVMRMTRSQTDAGGKGVNVARALHGAGIATTAVLPVGGTNGRELLRLLAAEGIATAAVEIDGQTRANVTLVEPGGRTSKINEPGPYVTATDAHRLRESVLRAAEQADWVVLAGSLPPGLATSFYTDLIAALRGAGAKVAVDCDGPLLGEVIAARPDLVKPNDHELAAATGLPADTPEQALEAARALQQRGAHTILASLGRRGALLLDDAGSSWLASAPAEQPRSTVGAGDATLAGFLAAGAQGPSALTRAVAYGTAAVLLPGTRMPAPSDVHENRVTLTSLTPEGSPR